MAGIKGRSGRKPKWTDEQIEEAAESLLDWFEDPGHVWLKGWAVENHIPPEYLSRWAAKNAIFHQAMELAAMTQEERLVTGGLQNKFNSRIVALCLESKHEWASRQAVAVTQEGSQQTLTDTLRQRMPEDPGEARQWLENIANGQGTDPEAQAVREAAGHEIRMLDMIELTRSLPSAFVG